MGRSVFILDPNNLERSTFCIGAGTAILNIFFEERESVPNYESFPIIEALFSLLHRLGTDRLVHLGRYLSEGLKLPDEIEAHIRQEVRQILRNPSMVPSRESILESWDLPFGTDM